MMKKRRKKSIMEINYTFTGLQLDVLAENSPMSSPRRTLPGGLTPTPSTPEKRQPNPNLTVNGTSDYPEIDNSQKDEVDIKQIKTPEPEPQQLVVFCDLEIEIAYRFHSGLETVLGHSAAVHLRR